MTHPHTPTGAPLLQRRLALATLLASAGGMLLTACGGGGGGASAGAGVASVDTGGTGSFSTGRISGFGSVIVNGVRYEDNAARIVDEDDGDKVLGAQDLRLGMVVRVNGGAVMPGAAGALATAVASAITVETQIKGPVESKTAPDTLVVFGQTVTVSAGTFFEGTSFDSIAVGNVLEVYGFADSAGAVAATRIEREGAANEYRVRDVIGNLDTAARTFRIGAAVFTYAATPADQLRAGALANGVAVRVRAGTVNDAGGAWPVLRIDARARLEDNNEAELEGILLQDGSTYSVNGIRVDVSRLPAGTALPVGERVEVEGALVNGVLVPREIEREDEDDANEVTAIGAASSVDTQARTFVVRGITFRYTAGVTREQDGTIAANLVNGAVVKAEGRLASGGNSAVIDATDIDFRP